MASFSSFQCPLILTRNSRSKFGKPISQIPFSPQITTPTLNPVIHSKKSDFSVLTAISPIVESREIEPEKKEEKFDWYLHWYPVASVCDLNKRRPHGKKVLGIDVVVWWDRNENAWKVFDDSCPHRLAPLSEGRIDQWGRLQCVYHGWCFGGAGDCKFIPQAPRDGPPNGIVWFWPNSDPKYKEIFSNKKPPYVPELDDPSYSTLMMTRDTGYGYEILLENIMDQSHVPYSHYGISETASKIVERQADREGGGPVDINITKLDINGFSSKESSGENYFIPPCLFYGYFTPDGGENMNKRKFCAVFFCIPVSPGNSRFIYAGSRNFAVWIDRLIPLWIFHMMGNLITDSDLNLLHLEERKLKEFGSHNWHKACYVPTKADAHIVAFRRWLNKYGGSQFDWRNKYTGELPPTPPREQLFDRYRSHTVQCSSCNSAYKGLNVLEVALQVISVSCIAIVAAAKQGIVSVAARYAAVCLAVLCFVASKWLSQFIHKTFVYHDYDHAFANPFLLTKML